ncbi:hypothetical protein ACQHIH_21845 (plasmid) [Xanthomonas sontii]|uniref:hypothetical protein n=1 Tax=Xanthomonas sontii TaxID=2650745 RepID=UPI003F853906
MLYSAMLALAVSAIPQVAIELAPEPGTSASGEPIASYDTRLARELVKDLERRGISAAIVEHGRARDGTSLAIRLHHSAIPAEWAEKGHASAFYGFALGIAQSNPDAATTISCTRMIGTALRQVGELPSLYRSFKLPGLDQPLLDTALGIHFAKGNAELLGRHVAALDLEVGIVSHPEDSKRLADPVVVAGLADAIASGVNECFSPTPDEDDEAAQAKPFVDPEMFK